MAARAPIAGSGEDRIVQANYKLEFDAGEPDTALVQTVSGIGIETRNAETREGGSRDPRFNAVDNTYPTVTITFTQIQLLNTFQAWIDLAKNGATAADRKRNVTVIPLNPDLSERPVLCTLVACSPMSLTLGDFDATSQDAHTSQLVVQPERVDFEANQG